MRARWIVVLVVILSSVVFPAAGKSQQALDRNNNEPALWPHGVRYLLQPGDVIEIKLQFTPEFDQTVTVQPDGFINLRELPDMRAAGRSTPELTEMLRKGYSRILHDPVVTLQLKEFEKPYFIAGGELGHPGKYDLRGDTTVLQAVQIAGGFKDSSKHSQVFLLRRVPDDLIEVKQLNMKAMLASGDLREDVHLRPGDMIIVPKNTISKIQKYIPALSLGSYFPH